MLTLKKKISVILLALIFIVASTACLSIPTQSESNATPSTSNTGGGAYTYIVNGKDKLPKLMRLYGEDTILTLVAYDLEDNELLRIEDVYHKNTNLNELLGAGEYKLLFYDDNGTLLTPSQEVGEILILKDGAENNSDTSPSTQNGSYTSSTITYAEEGSITLQFNLIKPAIGDNFPVVLWIHGGGFGPGGLNAAQGFEDVFTNEGYAIAAVAYRSMLEGYFPYQIQDINGAIRYLRANATSLQINPNRIFILGTSSGGLMASLVGVTGDVTEFEGTTGGNLNVSSHVTGVINLFGSVTLAQMDDLSPSILPNTYEIFGCTAYQTCPERYKLAIDNYITANDPPFLILHGTDDESVPYQESVELNEILIANNVSSIFITADGFGHDKEGIITKYFEDIISFLNETH